MTNENKMEEMEGQECWTNAFEDRFGERVCVMVEEGWCWNEGKKFKPTTQEKKELWKDFIFQELGSNQQILKDLEEEFGVKK